ncbi:hypothetical protein [Streptomyces sp. SAS_260]|uniref:hypothetical protein n=1 Tax=Streptomyces sp. SAS_260 TaxID=3412751 RepID=UPI00403CE280
MAVAVVFWAAVAVESKVSFPVMVAAAEAPVRAMEGEPKGTVLFGEMAGVGFFRGDKLRNGNGGRHTDDQLGD